MKPGFSQRVLEIVKRVPKGRVSTYADVARALGAPRAARAVGNALHNNPTSVTVPCHRVVRSDGGLGGYSRGAKKKRELLLKEGVELRGNRIDLERFRSPKLCF